MKKISKLLSFLFLFIITFSCTKEYTIPQNIVVHDFVWKGLNAYYLYQDEIADLSDRRFNSDQQLNTYLSSFSNYNTLFNSLLLPSDVKSNLIEDYTNLNNNTVRSQITNGMEYGIIKSPENPNNVLGYVTHILPNSNATTKSIKRGDFFYSVNNTQLTQQNYLDLLSNTSITLQMADFNGTVATPNTKEVILESLAYTYPAVHLEKTISFSGKNIGYLMYNNSFSENYLTDLNTSFLNFKNNNINDLILDFRYNIGGGTFAKNTAVLASMITGQFSEKTLIKEVWNTKAQKWFLANQPDSIITKFPSQIKPNININSLELTNIYIILNGNQFNGSSAIELLINSLKPYINVQVVGSKTSGNNTGSITLYNSADYDFPLRNESHTVALQPQVLRFFNSNDETYENGFTPNLELCTNENPLNLGVLGEISDPILNNVLNYISTNTVTPTSCNSLNFEFIYNSLTPQRTIDQGVFITRNLPNTN